MIDIKQIVSLFDTGTGDMGSLAYLTDSDTNNAARFGLDEMYVLYALRAHFTGTAGIADLTINVDHGAGPRYDFSLAVIEGDAGTGVGVEAVTLRSLDVNFRVQEDELGHWRFDGTRNDLIVPTWTNPDSGNITWGIECMLLPVTAIT